MAEPETLAGQQLFVKVGDGAGPEVFTHPCLINAARGVVFSSQGNDEYVPDCSNPDVPAIRYHIKTAIQMAVSGAGKLDTAALSTWLAWQKADTAKNVQVWFGTLGYVAVAMKLTQFEVNGDRGAFAEVSVSLESHGAIGDFVAAS